MLLLALGAQAVLFGVLAFFAVNGFPGFGGPSEVRDAGAATGTTVPRARADRFDGARALRLVRLQTSVGQRPAGSPSLRSLAERGLRPRLPRGRFEAVPGHPGLRNVVGTLPGRRPALVIGAHYDTEANPPGFVGANDSAAGTAAVLELARVLARLPRPKGAREVRFVLFDGEEEPPEGDGGDFYASALRGSKAYVSAHAEEVKALILLDYVANKGLRLPREGSSDEGLWRRLRTAARAVGVGAVFPAGTGVALLDDHTPFLRAGIPAVDLIDFSYRFKDTVADTPDKLSPSSIDAVGETVVELVRRLDRERY